MAHIDIFIATSLSLSLPREFSRLRDSSSRQRVFFLEKNVTRATCITVTATSDRVDAGATSYCNVISINS